MLSATAYLEERFGVKQEEKMDHALRGILHTDNYEAFMIRSDVGEILHTFVGAKRANRCLPGDHVRWDEEAGHCILELSDEHPLLVGTLHLTSPARYGFTSRKVPLYLFTPYDERYPQMIVGSTEKDKTCNRICLVQCDSWSPNSLFPRGLLQQMLGRSGDLKVEKKALLHQVCPWKYPSITFHQVCHESFRQRIVLHGTTFHIDPPGCRDVDDVITLERVDDMLWKVIVTISDVASYVEDGSAVDIMASLISQSVYDSTGCILHSMLPKTYAEETCSLLPGETKRGISMEMLWDGVSLSEPSWYESTLEVKRSYTYDTFQTEMDPETILHREVIKQVSSFLAGEMLYDAHEWVEQMMLHYNKQVGKKLQSAGIGILRRHEATEQKRLELYRQHLPEWRFLAMNSAEYVLAEEKDTYHSGLDTNAYAHATSPIRRYADLVNQRILKELLHHRQSRYIVPVTMADMNRRERCIRQFERDMTFLNAIQNGEVRVKAIVIGKEESEDEQDYCIQFYIPSWKKRVTTRYRKAGENLVESKDGTETREVILFQEVEVQCSIQWSQKNWRERLLIQWL